MKTQGADKRLQSAYDQLSLVSYTTHHDLKGGLDGLRFVVELIKQMVSAEQRDVLGLNEPLELIRMEVEKQNFILDGMKDWLAMMKDGEAERAPVDLNKVLDSLQRNSLYSSRVICAELPVLYGCYGQFLSLFDNLIRNALHYNDKAERWVKIYQRKNSVVVEDNGNGFPNDKFDMLCKPFHRLETEKTGSGLGLAIIKGICDNHQLGFRAESKLGIGSRFFIDF